MLPDFRIQNFRCFRDLHLKGLGRVNLLVGKNNTGKTTVLEALSLWARGGAPDELLKTLDAREMREEDPREWFSRLESVFLGGQARTTLGPSEPNRRVEVALQIEGEVVALPGLLDKASKSGERLLYRVLDGRRTFDREATREDMQRWQPNWTPMCDRIFVRADGLDEAQVERLWATTAGFQAEDEIVAALGIIEPEVARIYRLRTGASTSEFRLRRSDRAEPEPLQRFGDGMRRVLELALTMVNSSGKMLLIDEFENGIHFEAQEPLWRWLLQAAARLDVQVFATTHSLDCVRGFTNAIADHPEQGTLYRLARWRGDIMAFAMDEQDLVTAARHEMEVR